MPSPSPSLHFIHQLEARGEPTPRDLLEGEKRIAEEVAGLGGKVTVLIKETSVAVDMMRSAHQLLTATRLEVEGLLAAPRTTHRPPLASIADLGDQREQVRSTLAKVTSDPEQRNEAMAGVMGLLEETIREQRDRARAEREQQAAEHAAELARVAADADARRKNVTRLVVALCALLGVLGGALALKYGAAPPAPPHTEQRP